MKRREFLKTGASLSSFMLVSANPLRVLSKFGEDDANHAEFAVGDQIPPEVFVQDKSLQRLSLQDICQAKADASVILLFIYGGGFVHKPERIGGIWCVDSFEDLYIIRYIKNKYAQDPVDFIPVACPPLYSSHYYGLKKRIFLDEPEESQEFQDSADAFVQKTEEVITNKFLPMPTYYDLRFRLLFNRSEEWRPGEGYGEIYDWQGKFRANEETQKYGTPTLWLINSEGVILEKPFWGNLYHSEPFEIRYTVKDVDKAVARNL
ncbi:MAG: hypothetical protein ACE5HO_07820 [bacterium]